MDKKTLSLIIPVYNEEESLRFTLERLLSIAERREDIAWEFLFVNDGSQDGSRELINSFCEQFDCCKAIHFSRNFGHQIALTAGLDHAHGDYVAVIDADLQDPPELILTMLEVVENGANLAYGQRTERLGESWFKIYSARVFYRVLASITNVQIPLDTGDFRLMDRKVADAVRSMRENPRFMRGMFAWVGFNSVAVPYQRHSRVAGETKYTFKRMVRFALDALFSFSDVPLRLAVYMGFAVFSIGSLGIAYMLLSSLFLSKAISATMGLLFVVAILGGLQLLTLGIIGQYISLIFEQAKKRPIYVMDETVNVPVHQSRMLERVQSVEYTVSQ
jgi:dolichol-phosphate mannosyltransferase